MKKILLILITFCMSAGFAFGQLNWKVDSNIVCSKATKLNLNVFLYDSYQNKVGYPDYVLPAYYSFIPTSKNILLKLSEMSFLTVSLYDSICNQKSSLNEISYTKIYLTNIEISKIYKLKLEDLFGIRPKFKIGVFNIIENDYKIYPSTLIENISYNFNTNNYSNGRDISTSCKTSKADSNTVDLFVKFTASATNETIIVNSDNANYETLVELTTAPNTCNAAFQKGQNQRFYTFSGLTIGTEYTARVEFGGDAPIGFARLNAANNASIVLKSGVVTSLEYNITQSSFQISPNPNNGSFSFKSNEESDLSIYDLLGNKVYEQNAVLNKDLNLSLSQGIYFIHVKNDIGVQVQKMVIE